MVVTNSLDEILRSMTEEQQRLVFDFARFVAHEHERREWRNAGIQQFARAYGDDEPDYTEADIRPDIGA